MTLTLFVRSYYTSSRYLNDAQKHRSMSPAFYYIRANENLASPIHFTGRVDLNF